MNNAKSIGLLLILSLLSFPARAADEGERLEFTRLDLTDGRKLKNVVVKSYDPSRTRFLVVASGKAMLIPAELVPAPFSDQLKLTAPRSGATTAVAPTQYVPAPAPADGKAKQVPYSEFIARQPQSVSSSRPNPTSPASADAARIRNEQLLAQQREQSDQSNHRALALQRAQNYYRYEYPVGSSASRVSALNFEVESPEPITGWAGRYRTKGKALVEFFDSKGWSYGRTTSTYEVITEQKPGEYPKVIDFSIKS